ncbi:MAG: putative hydroxymethylpyrimidine transport system substrate-binding protein [Thermoleophilaceae bacterium]|nr:putative hydroxymethylpyrimidine transport system substrate-binding protein [Thermoleophilaceae bacterium]
MRRTGTLLLVAAAIAGCGGGGSGSGQPATIAIDFTPNAVHAPIYAAVRKGFDRRHGIRLTIRGPGASPDSLKLLLAGKADVAVLDIHDLGLARERGADVVGIGALVDRPLAAIVSAPGIHRPRDLEGKRVGVSGLPSDPAVLRPVMQADGGSFSKLKLITIGFNAVPNLLARKVSGVPAFWNVEGVVLRQRGFNPRIFKLDDYGAPHYPEVVLVTKRATLEKRRKMLQGMLAAIADGARSVLSDPGPAVDDVARAAEADRGLIAAELKAVTPVLDPTLGFDRAVLEQWATFDARFGILHSRPDVSRTFALDLRP